MQNVNKISKTWNSPDVLVLMFDMLVTYLENCLLKLNLYKLELETF